MQISELTITINARTYTFAVGTRFGEIQPSETLAETLRNRLGLTGSKIACNEGACGCCTVIMNGDAVTSCMLLTLDCDGAVIQTIEGLQDPVTGALDPIQQAFIDRYAFQCGYCTPGIIMTTKALLDKNQSPSQADIEQALSGNYCRCISHYHVFEAIGDVVQSYREGSKP
jgi:aerobic-type carbon monoxide dehydrogenase small subunit (CoxS/CutS family)